MHRIERNLITGWVFVVCSPDEDCWPPPVARPLPGWPAVADRNRAVLTRSIATRAPIVTATGTPSTTVAHRIEQLIEGVKAEFDAYTKGEERRDDLTIVAIAPSPV